MYGRVTKFFHDRGYGFILGEDGNTYFVHVSKLYGEYLDRGYYVFSRRMPMTGVIITLRM